MLALVIRLCQQTYTHDSSECALLRLFKSLLLRRYTIRVPRPRNSVDSTTTYQDFFNAHVQRKYDVLVFHSITVIAAYFVLY